MAHGPSWSIMVHHGPLKAFGLCSRQQVSKPFTAFESNVFLVVSECLKSFLITFQVILWGLRFTSQCAATSQ